MQTIRRLVLASILIITGVLIAIVYSQYDKKTSNCPPEKAHLFSKLVGYKIWNELKDSPEHYLLEDIIEGMRDCQADKPPPKEIGSEDELLFSSEMEEHILEDSSRKNLAIATSYLAHIATKPCIIEVEKGKVYYEVLQEGEGSEVAAEKVYTFHYTIMTQDFKIVQDTRQSNSPKEVFLSDAIIGFARGVVGMKIGEKRRLYIHPDMAYRNSSWHLPPQSLLIIEVEVIS